ncbi:ABC transporter substrate-binding protein [Modestobacter marinus]|uniref:4,5-dihydroxyphthalate decarboxylase n=1 Tax=Modestobacter marinus TaxID=477641 RepID=A0A846LHZ8_9ACTN|nr:ABC transporter substrate-binding protein [Modestobacter marinus]NIH67187.1 4,5-dihydroxyphthalate decarboxylase [Modestobacter marinus]GGL52757.1 4,5-dihydroxyphthalate decarboxylase [Modestobacter marinus]
MSRLRLTFACGDYDRTRALAEGTILPDGIDLNYLRLPVEETFFRMMRHREFEVAEMSLSSYVKSLDSGGSPFVALPVYTSRQFRHTGVFVHADAGIERPEDLRGKIVGTPEWQLTAGVWIRGMLADQYGVPVDSVSYRTGGQETPGRIEKAAVDLGGAADLQPISEGETLSGMLADGRIDALQSPRVPSSFVPGGPVRRLFADPVAAEKQYFSETGIFPIMHVVVVRRDVYEANRWVAQSLTKALTLAKQQAMVELYDSSALRFMLPWLIPGLEEARSLLGEDYWSYGLEQNIDTLTTFLRYHHGQGLSRRRLDPEELFAPEALEAFVI